MIQKRKLKVKMKKDKNLTEVRKNEERRVLMQTLGLREREREREREGLQLNLLSRGKDIFLVLCKAFGKKVTDIHVPHRDAFLKLTNSMARTLSFICVVVQPFVLYWELNFQARCLTPIGVKHTISFLFCSSHLG